MSGLTPASDPEFITYTKGAHLLSVSTDTIERRVRDGVLTRYDIGGPDSQGRRTRRLRRREVLALAVPVDPQGYAHPVDGAE